MAFDEHGQRQAADPPAALGHPADLELAHAALRGDESALRGLSLRLTCVPRYVTGWNRREHLGLDDAEIADVCQEVLILAWRKLESFHGRASLETWAFGLAMGQLRNAVRAKRRRTRRFVTGPLADGEADCAHEPGAPFALGPEDSLAVHAAVDDLPAGEAQIVRLKHFDGQTFEELAANLGISPNTAKSRYYRALVRLAVALRRLRDV